MAEPYDDDAPGPDGVADPVGAPLLPARTGPERTARSVAAIVDAAEQAATKMRAEAERRGRERIAEADRAAAMRVNAAEAEARDILGEAQRDAAQVHSEAKAAVAGIHAEAQRVREEAEKGRLAAAAEGAAEATRLRQEAEVDARRLRTETHAEARALLADAHAATNEVAREGEEITTNLRALAQSLVRNAELLTRDVRDTHADLTGRLSDAEPPPEPAAPPRAEPKVRTALPAAGRRLGTPDWTPAAAAPELPSRPVSRSVTPEPVAARARRSGRGGSVPLPAEIADLLGGEDASLEVPDFARPRRLRRP